MTTNLEAVNKILLLSGERRVATRNSSPPAEKAEDSLIESIREFSLLNDWPFLTSWVNATSWNGSVASFNENVIRILRVKDANGKEHYHVGEDLRRVMPPYSYKYTGNNINEVEVPTSNAGTAMTFLVVTYGEIAANDTDNISLPELAVSAVIKRAVAYFNLRHLDDAAIAAQYSAEYEVMVQQLREKYGKVPNGYYNMYRRLRF